MEILKWFLLVNLILGTIFSIALIGHERPKYSVSGAVFSFIINGALSLWILHAMP